MKSTLKVLIGAGIGFFISAMSASAQYPTMGSIEIIDSKMKDLVDVNAKIEVLASGFVWSEGPVWIPSRKSILFSDVPKNVIYEWEEKNGLTEFLKPSGYTGVGIYSDEPGSNGLLLDKKGNLIACEHGDRRISSMSLTVGGKKTVVDNYGGKRLNSPNDVAEHPISGDLYFTDPPYGLAQKAVDPTREVEDFGVYRIKNNQAELVVSNLSRPNGLAFSPDGKILYVAVSDSEKPYIMKYRVDSSGNISNGTVFYDATLLVKKGDPGLPDGLKVDQLGNLWTTGPGGVLVISQEGKLLGRIFTGKATANCAWAEDGSVLYMTAHQYLVRIKTKTKGANWK